MPTYDYVCAGCEHTFEAFQSIKANALKKCPACGEPKLKRLIGTGAGVIFKGSGFYETDYRSDSYKKAAKAESGDGGGDKAASTKGEAGGKSEAGSSTSSKEGASPASPAPAKSESPSKPTTKPGGDAGKAASS